MDSNINKWISTNSFNYNNDERWFEIMIKCDELVSINTAHGMNTRTKVVYDNPWTVRFKNQLKQQLIMSDPVKNCPWITYGEIYYLTIYYLFKSGFWSRDLDNVHKITQDIISDACKINDSHILEINLKKFYKPGDYDYAIIKFGTSSLDYNRFIK